ncbi:MAG TPA: phage holin family protein [Azospirillaceae bacterium]|nr:phage holin family protein [Azospirillaceae bacterium]
MHNHPKVYDTPDGSQDEEARRAQMRRDAAAAFGEGPGGSRAEGGAFGETIDEGPKERRSIGSLFVSLINESTTLIRQEIDLARAEVSEKIGQAGRGSAMLAAGGLVALVGLIFLLLAAVYALSNVVEPWLAALIVGAVTTAIGVVLLLMGKSRLSADALQPKRTLETLEEDREWARAQVRR